MSQREAILSKIDDVPSLPAAATKVMQMVQSENVNIAELTKAIELDPGLTSNMLRMANSPAFGATRVIGSMREAVVRLGMKTIMQLVMTSTVAPMTMKEIKGYDLPAGDLWERSAGAAFGAELVADFLGIHAPPFTFTAGLLHDIGKIVLGTFVEIDAQPIVEMAFDKKISFEQAEREILGIDHAEVGALLLENWKLPSDIVECTRWHHRPDQAPNSQTMIDLVHIGSELCTLCGIGIGRDGLNYRPCSSVVERLQISNAVMEKACLEIVNRLNDLRAVFNIKKSD